MQQYKKCITASNIKLGLFDFTLQKNTSLVNDSGYLSTPFFVMCLTNLGSIILNAQNREEALFDGLQQINKHLPANVYIPFVNESMRNYVVLHIKAMESKIFVTKSRAPYLICVEVFRPEESKFQSKIDEADEHSTDSESDNDHSDIEMQEGVKVNSKCFVTTIF